MIEGILIWLGVAVLGLAFLLFILDVLMSLEDLRRKGELYKKHHPGGGGGRHPLADHPMIGGAFE